MLEHKSVVNQIEVTGQMIQVRIALQIVNGADVIDSKWHRTAFPIAQPNAARQQMEEVNRHLAEMGKAPVSEGDIVRVEAIHNAAMNLG